MQLKVALNTITIKNATLDEKIAAAAGYDGLGLWNDEITPYLEAGGTYAELRQKLSDAGLAVPEVCYVGGWMFTKGLERGRAFDEARRRFEQCAEVGAGCSIACAAGGTGEMSRAAADFADLCQVAAEFGMKAALEFIGMAEMFKNVAAAWKVIQEADQPNGGLLLDTFHFHRGGSRIEDLEEVPVDGIYCVHLNDALDKPREELTDLDRVHVGLGALPLGSLLGALTGKGYRGFVSIEIFNEEYWSQPARKVAMDSLDHLRRFLEKQSD